jgi:hypothetical protein
MMEGSRLITQVLPVVTIVLAVVFFLALKLSKRAKNKARGEQTNLALMGLQIGPETENLDPERRKLICPALVEEPRGILKTSLQELTLSGAFLTCPNPRPIGQAFQLRIQIDPSNSLEFKAEVLWNNKNVSADKIIHRGMRIRFLQLSPEDRKTLSDIVNEPRAENLFT